MRTNFLSGAILALISTALPVLALPTTEFQSGAALEVRTNEVNEIETSALLPRASIFDLCFKSPNPPPRVTTQPMSAYFNIEAAVSRAPSFQTAVGNRHVQFSAYTTDNLGTFRGHLNLRFEPLFHIVGEEFRWTLSWRRGGSEGCVRGGVMSVREQTVSFTFSLDSSMEYFFTVARM